MGTKNMPKGLRFFGDDRRDDPAKLDRIADLKVLGAKNDAGKLRIGLVDDVAIEALASVLTLGAHKYSEGGWRHVVDSEQRYYEATMRHLLKWRKFLRTRNPIDAIDAETGFPHIAQALCNVHFLAALHLAEFHPEFDGEAAAKLAIEKWEKRKVELMNIEQHGEVLDSLVNDGLIEPVPASKQRRKPRKKAVRK